MKYYEVNFTIDAPQGLLQDARDLTAALAGEAGLETFAETDEGLVGYAQRALFDKAALQQQLCPFPLPGVGVTYTVADAPDQDWNAAWESVGFDPIVIGNQCVVHDGRHLPAGALQAWPLTIEIDARQAFGTGTHETTRLMAAAMLRLPLRDMRLLDCGTGTGILAIVGLKAGARQAVAYDIDEWSVDNARHNAVINGVDSRIDVRLGSGNLLDGAIGGTFDLVTANINRNILLADMHRFAAHLAPQGTLLLSGFYQADVSLLSARAADLGLHVAQTTIDNGWACLTIQPNNT